jgi:hypothetical protein
VAINSKSASCDEYEQLRDHENQNLIANLVETRGVFRVTINSCQKVSHDPQLVVICTNVNVEMLHIVLGAFPPVFRVVCDIVCVSDDGRFAILGTSGSIKVEAI